MRRTTLQGETEVSAETLVHNTPRFFGVFDVLNRMDLPNTEVTDIYSGHYSSKIYEDFIGNVEYPDIVVYLDVISRAGGPVLELGCGSGRVTLPVARDGWNVTAVDLSRRMLKLLRQKLSREPNEISDRVNSQCADVTTFESSEKFPSIILSGATICLLHSAEAKAALFARVAENLAEGGYFAFDFFPLREETHKSDGNVQIDTSTATPDFSGRQFTLFGQLYVPEEQVYVSNFYREMIDGSGRTRRSLSSQVRDIVVEAEIRKLLHTTGFSVESVVEYELSYGPSTGTSDPGNRMKLFVCRKLSSAE